MADARWKVSSDEVRPWRASNALAAARHSIPARKPPSRPTVRHRSASGNGGGAGSRRGAGSIPNTETTSRGRKQSWAERHRDYWRQYRQTHPQYSERNRVLQRERDARRRERVLAKMDVSARDSPVASGTYRLSPVTRDDLAKMDAWVVRITVVSKQYAPTR